MLQAITQEKEKLAYSVEEISEITSLSKAYVRFQIKQKKLKAKLIGRRVLVFKEDLREFLENKEDWKPINER